jgi:DMSO/TMAO reductase YedYZ molybdopterin-dependent catalytic subunit
MATSTRFVSLALLVTTLALFITGGVMIYGTWLPWVFTLHRIAGWTGIALLPWKAASAVASVRRRTGRRGGWRAVAPALVLALLDLLVILSALMWMWRVGPYLNILGFAAIVWHWALGFLMVPLFAYHVAVRWIAPRPSDVAWARRSALRWLAFGAAGVVGWLVGEGLARARATETVPRRALTGSPGFGLAAGNAFPVTGESGVEIDVAPWRLRLTGAVARPLALTYDELLARGGTERRVILDCSNGWYTTQDWQGVPLIDLLEEAGLSEMAAGVRLISASAYNHTFPLTEARTILLATHVGGEVLAPGHGFPLRAVVPDRRGWFWVKWVTRIEVVESLAEVAGRTLYAPREILRQW